MNDAQREHDRLIYSLSLKLNDAQREHDRLLSLKLNDAQREHDRLIHSLTHNEASQFQDGDFTNHSSSRMIIHLLTISNCIGTGGVHGTGGVKWTDREIKVLIIADQIPFIDIHFIKHYCFTRKFLNCCLLCLFTAKISILTFLCLKIVLCPPFKT